jgi:alkaline phosphatase
MNPPRRLPRRQFLRSGLSAAALILLPGGVALHGAAAAERFLRLRLEPADARPFQRIAFGLLTDTHYGDFPDTDRPRFFRSSLDNMSESAAIFTDEHLDFAVHLGDVIQEAGNRPASSRWLRAFDERFATFAGERHYVMGNHDLRDLTKAQFLNMTSGMYARNHYSFDRAGHRFIVLDANFRQDGRPYAADDFNYRDTWIPATQLDWLETQLEQARRIGRRAIIFAHQCFDATSHDSMIKNAPQVRALFERMGNVAAVFYGHRHAGGYFRINGIPYVGVVATVNGPDIAAAVVNIYDNGTIVVRGHGRQPSWAPFHAIDQQGNPLWP